MCALSLALMALVGAIDYYTGHDLALSLFYLLPVSVAAARVNPAAGVAVAILSAVIWTTTNKLAGKPYSYAFIFYWNMTIRAVLFTVCSLLMSQFRKAFEIEKEFARNDTLTNVPNRKAFYERMNQEIHRMRRYKRPLTIAYVDCDRFKQINDEFGHQVGDTALRLIASSLKQSIRAIDMVARIGGDEFIILLPETDNTQAQVVLSRVRDKACEIMQGKNWPVNLSIGAATFAGPLDSIDEMIKRADSLMYVSKKGRKGSITAKLYTNKA